MTQVVWAVSFGVVLGALIGATLWWYLRGQRDVAARVLRRRPDLLFCQEAVHSSTKVDQWAPVEGWPCVVAVDGDAIEVLTAFGKPRYRYTWSQVRSAGEAAVRRGIVEVPGVELRVANRWEDPVRLTFPRGNVLGANGATARQLVSAIAERAGPYYREETS